MFQAATGETRKADYFQGALAEVGSEPIQSFTTSTNEGGVSANPFLMEPVYPPKETYR